MITEVIYWFGKVFFSLAGLYYLYSWYVGDLDTFAHVTGIVAVVFLVSNIKWYFFNR